MKKIKTISVAIKIINKINNKIKNHKNNRYNNSIHDNTISRSFLNQNRIRNKIAK